MWKWTEVIGIELARGHNLRVGVTFRPRFVRYLC